MIVKLQGGMGNQCFQAAYAMTNGAKLDRSGIQFPREYALDPFHLPIEFEDNVKHAQSGYWQSEKHFDHELIRREFSCPFPRPILDCIAVHVRLTDNLSDRAKSFHGNLLDTDYYQKAFKLMEERVGRLPVLIFSDDPLYCLMTLNMAEDCLVVQGNRPHEDLWEMARCKHIIIANSSFSWWSAWLGDTQPNRTVICPKRWFADIKQDSSEICPERWFSL